MQLQNKHYRVRIKLLEDGSIEIVIEPIID
jgi:hypothetical protein